MYKLCDCGNDRCTGKYLLHPHDFDNISSIIEAEQEIHPGREGILMDRPSDEDKELHIIAAPDEDLDNFENNKGVSITVAQYPLFMVI